MTQPSPVFRLIDPARVRSPHNPHPTDPEDLPSRDLAQYPDHYAFLAEPCGAKQAALPFGDVEPVLVIEHARGCAAPGILLPADSAEARAYAREQTARGARRETVVVLDQHGREVTAVLFRHDYLREPGEPRCWGEAKREGRRLVTVQPCQSAGRSERLEKFRNSLPVPGQLIMG